MTSKNELVPKEVHLANAGLKNLPDHWSVVEVGELLSEDRGISVGVMYPGNHDPLGVPLIKVGDLMGSVINPNPEFRVTPEKHYEYRRTELEGGELLLTLVGAVGQCAVVPPSMAGWNAARAVAVLRLKNHEDAKFMRLCLLSAPLQHLMQVWANTTVQATLNLKEIKQLPLPWPPKEEREAIAHILGTLDDKIELNQQMNHTLESIARALFKSWFIDFDPVRAKMDGRQPAGMDAETAALFPDEFEDSAIGEIPTGWSVVTLGDVARIKHGYAFKSEFFVEPELGIPIVVNIGNFKYEGGFRFENTSLKGYAGEYPSEFILLTGEILLVMTCQTAGGEILGIPGRIPADERTYLHNQRMGKVVITDPHRVNDAFLYQLFLRPEFNQELFATASGTKILHTSPNRIEAFRFCLPPEALQRKTKNTLENLENKAMLNDAENKALSSIRNALLPKLLSGEIRVKDAERIMEVVA